MIKKSGTVVISEDSVKINDFEMHPDTPCPNDLVIEWAIDKLVEAMSIIETNGTVH